MVLGAVVILVELDHKALEEGRELAPVFRVGRLQIDQVNIINAIVLY